MIDPMALSLDAARPEALAHAVRLLRGDRPAAEEVVEDVVGALWIRRRLAGCSEPYSVGYVVASVSNAVINRWRRRQRHDSRQCLIAATGSEGAVQDESEEVLLRLELVKLLEHLSERQRQLLTLRYLWGLSQGEVAARLGVPQGTVASATSRAVDRLRALAA